MMSDEKGLNKKIEKAAVGTSNVSISSYHGQLLSVDPGPYPVIHPFKKAMFSMLTQSHQYKIKLISWYVSKYVGGIQYGI